MSPITFVIISALDELLDQIDKKRKEKVVAGLPGNISYQKDDEGNYTVLQRHSSGVGVFRTGVDFHHQREMWLPLHHSTGWNAWNHQKEQLAFRKILRELNYTDETQTTIEEDEKV